MTNTKVTPDPRVEYIAGLRELADLLEANPQLELPHTGRSIYGQVSVIPFGAEEQREQLAAWAKALPGRKDKSEGGEDGTYLRLNGRIRGLHIQVICHRDEVCEKVVTGTREVTEEVLDPEALTAVPKVTVTKTVEDVSWVCKPLLATDTVTALEAVAQ